MPHGRRWIGSVAIVVAAAITVAVANQAQPLTAEQVLDRMVGALGGKEANDKLRNRICIGKTTLGSERSLIVIKEASPNLCHSLAQAPGKPTYSSGCDGANCWAIERGEVIKFDGKKLATRRRLSQFNQFVRWREIYSRAEYSGVERRRGHDCHKLAMYAADGAIDYWYIDTSTWLPFLTAYEWPVAKGNVTIDTTYSDYREIDGVKVAHQLQEQLSTGEYSTITTFDVILHNLKFEKEDFAISGTADGRGR